MSNQKSFQNTSSDPEGCCCQALLADLSDRCCAFEEREGFEQFAKACGSAMNRLLVKKGVVTVEEICGAMADELDRRESFSTNAEPSHPTDARPMTTANHIGDANKMVSDNPAGSGVDDRRLVLADCPETSAALKASNGQWSFELRDAAMRLESERDALARRLAHLIRRAYTQRGNDGVLYWCCEVFPADEHETFNEALDAEIFSENKQI